MCKFNSFLFKPPLYFDFLNIFQQLPEDNGNKTDNKIEDPVKKG